MTSDPLLPARRRFLAHFAAAPLLLRQRSETGALESSEPLDPRRSAVILCDLWDKHWCRGATARVNEIVARAEPFLRSIRAKGFTVIHAPSDTMDAYRDAPGRLAILDLPDAIPPKPLDISDPPLPIDDSDGGCDTPGDKQHRAWSHQHPGISILPGDFITDKGTEVYRILKAKKLDRLFVMGVHTNMCILNRTFAIKQMRRWGVRCILIRDMTDAMYDPQDRPFVPHARGTELVIEHIERYWCPTTTSEQILAAL